ncbi:hypothetical protein [Mucilaginibacter sp.]|uniref:hypothetical protein n=1 Tax=Mucilaginibacter sp. TaxID=1882438 RepID=UPI0025FF4C2F|nr:hypothetical protein [Mucilaginibacter sp.]
MKNKIVLLALLVIAIAANAQKVALPLFLKWETNNSPGCKNVFITKDSILLAVKTPCVSEGVRANWRPSAGISESTPFAVRAGASVNLVITYKFIPQGGDVFAFYGTVDPANRDAGLPFSANLELKGGVKALPPSAIYTTMEIPVNFSDSMDSPVSASPAMFKGFMDFHFNVTADGGDTHQGSIAVIKEMHVEIK